MKENVYIFINRILWIFGSILLARCAISFSDIVKNGIDINYLYNLYGYISDALIPTMILAFLYEKYLWRFDKIARIPVVQGRYNGYLISTWDEKKRQSSLEIKQTLFSLSIIMRTEESRSTPVFATITKKNGETQIIYSYLNTPKAKVRCRSEIHYGSAILFMGEKGILEGSYYTDRKTNGDLYFKKV